MKNRNRKFRCNCELKRFNKSFKLLKEVFNISQPSQKEIYKLADGKKLPKIITIKKQNKLNERIKKLSKQNIFFDISNLE